MVYRGLWSTLVVLAVRGDCRIPISLHTFRPTKETYSDKSKDHWIIRSKQKEGENKGLLIFDFVFFSFVVCTQISTLFCL
jgi:hypothetical protein